jgi:hypothetical protein
LETISKSEQDLRVKGCDDLGKFVGDCLERKAGPIALDVIAVLAVLGAGESDLEVMRGRAKASGAMASDAKTWGVQAWKKLGQQTAVAWRDLMKNAQKQGLGHAACRFAGIIVLLDPNDAAAHAVLGHVKVKDLWMLKFDADKAKFNKAIRVVS